MSRISKKEYQKVVEKNKTLLEEINLLTSEELSFENVETIAKWREALAKVGNLKHSIKSALEPKYKHHEYDYDRSIHEDILESSIFGKYENNFSGEFWTIESIETGGFLHKDNYITFGGFNFSNPNQERPIPYKAEFTDDPSYAIKFKTEESAEYFLFHRFHYLDIGCYIEDICKINKTKIEL